MTTPKYVRLIKNRHGNDRLQFQRRRGSPKKIMTTKLGTAEFETEYHRLVAGLEPGASPKSEKHLDQFGDSVGALATAYFGGDDFQRMHHDSQTKVRRLVNNVLEMEPPFKGKPRKFASWPCDLVTPTTIKDVRSALKPTRPTKDPKARNYRDQHVQFFRAVWTWGVQNWTRHDGAQVIHLLRTANPCARLKPLAPAESAGWHTMTEAEVTHFENHHPVGTMARLAMAILRYTAARRSDVAILGAPMLVQDGDRCFLAFTEEKNKGHAPKHRTLAVKDTLLQIIRATPGAMKRDTFIVGTQGRRLLRQTFGIVFKGWCVEAGLPHCSCHSVRKFVATYLAENEATPHTIQAIGGWTNLRQVMRYTKAAERRRLSTAAVGML